MHSRGCRRIEGRDKTTGETRFVADMYPRGMAFAKLVLSPYAHARIASVKLDEARNWPGSLLAVGGDGLPVVNASESDQPLARGRVVYAGQPVVAVVAETREQAADAAARVEIEWEPLRAVLDPFEAMKPDSPIVVAVTPSQTADDAGAHGMTASGLAVEERPPNVTSMHKIQMGDFATALAEAAHVAGGVYYSPPVNHAFIEPHATIAEATSDSRVTIWTATQGMFHTRRMTAHALGLPIGSIRVVPLAVGGGFGGKVLLLEPLAALLAQLINRPVLIELTRTEEFLMGRSAPGSHVELKLVADSRGQLTGLWARAFFDNGACAGTLAPFGASLLSSVYRFPSFDYVGYDICTNKTPSTAYRAPGAPQAFFAMETTIDEIAMQVGDDPIQFRLKNIVREGDRSVEGGTWPHTGLADVLERASRHPTYTRPADQSEGVGVAVGGWRGGREPAAALCQVETDGTVAIRIGSVDISGTDTGLAILAGQAFGVSPDQVRVERSDTAGAPYAGMAGGSKITYTVGPAVIQAALDARNQVFEIVAQELEASPDDLVLVDGHIHVAGAPNRGRTIGEVAASSEQFGGLYRPILGRGQSVVTESSPMYTVHVARVRVDPETGHVTVTDYAAIQDVGRAINPPEIRGQMYGGAVQGIGRAIGEQLRYDDDGQTLTASFIDYDIPTIDQVPNIETELVEVPSLVGPYGAKGVGEPPAIPGPAAIANSVRRAVGVRLTELPLSADHLVGQVAESTTE